MINISQNLFNADILEVFADGEQIGTIEILEHLERYEAKPKEGKAVTRRSLNLCKNYFQNLHKGRERKVETNTEPQTQLNLF